MTRANRYLLASVKNAVNADNSAFQSAVKGSLHQSGKITLPISGAVDVAREASCNVAEPVGTDYLLATLSADVTLSAGQDILFGSVWNHSTMAYDPATGLMDMHQAESYRVHLHLIVSATNTDFTIDLVDDANVVLDAPRKCSIGSRLSCEGMFIQHSHTAAVRAKLRVTAGTGTITIKAGSSICVDEIGTDKLRTTLDSIGVNWYSGGALVATSGQQPKVNGELPSTITAAVKLPYLTDVEAEAVAVSTDGFTVAPSSRVLYRTRLHNQLTLSGLSGTNNLVRILVGESAGAVGADFHCNGNSRKFPAAAGDGGDWQLRNATDTADLVFYVSSVSGVTPNRIATLLVAVDAPTGIVIRGEGGSSQATRAAPYTATNFAGTGGTRTQVGDDFVHVFNAGGTLIIPNGVRIVRVLAVAGGGGGGHFGGGGGGGGLVEDAAFAVTPGASIPVTVGGGGVAAESRGVKGGNGGNSIFSTITAQGGGGGGSDNNAVYSAAIGDGADGGCGGGTAYWTASTAGAGAQGGNGGLGHQASTWSGGGGGAGGNGANAVTGNGGAGGVGLASTITGTAVNYAGGGGAMQNGAGTDGGGTGAYATGAATAGTNGLGGGGGGAGNGASGAGGSGIVVVRYTPYITGAFVSMG